MAFTYYLPVIITVDGTVVGIRHIESINIEIDDSHEAVINKLKADTTFKISTTGGREYQVSLIKARSWISGFRDIPLDEFFESFYQKWLFVLKNKLE